MSKDCNNICASCTLGKTSIASTGENITNIPGIGNESAKIMFVVDSPNDEDLIAGQPISSSLKTLLENAIEKAGYSTDDVYIVNAIRCTVPTATKLTKARYKECREHLINDIERINPKVICTLGSLSQELVFPFLKNLYDRGTLVYAAEFDCYAFTSYHPSRVVRDKKYRSAFYKDVERSLNYALNEEEYPLEEVKHEVITTVERFQKFKDFILKKKFFTIDIETSGFDYFNDSLLCIALSWKKGHAVTVPILGKLKAEIWSEEDKKIIEDGLREIVESPVKMILHNGKFDLKFFINKLGCDIDKTLDSFYFDTMLAHHLVDENAIDHRLKTLARMYTLFGNYEDILEEHKELAQKEYKEATGESLAKADVSYDMFDTAVLWKYANFDADVTIRAFKILHTALKEDGLFKFFMKLVMALNKVLLRMELNGIRIDKEILQTKIAEFTTLSEKLYSEIVSDESISKAEDILTKAEVDKLRTRYDNLKRKALEWEEYYEKYKESTFKQFNLKSPNHLQVLFYKVLGAAPVYIKETPAKRKKREKAGKPQSLSTDKDALEFISKKHQFPVTDAILKYRNVVKFLNTFLEGIAKRIYDDGRLRTDYKQHGTVTGRLSSTNPNLQNIPKTKRGFVDPKEIRRMFICDEGWTLLEADYGQIEFRVLAEMSRDKKLLKDIKNGLDIHAKVAGRVYPNYTSSEEGLSDAEIRANGDLRNNAKGIVFGNLMYGRGLKSLQDQLGVSKEEAKAAIDFFGEEYPETLKCIEDIKQNAIKKGYSLNIFGRKRRLPQLLKLQKKPLMKFEDEERGKLAEGLRQSVNSPIQSSAADIMGIALIRLDKRIRKENLPVRLQLQIHDAVVAEVRDDFLEEWLYILREEMTRPIKDIVVPLVIDTEHGKNWADLKTFKYKEKRAV